MAIMDKTEFIDIMNHLKEIRDYQDNLNKLSWQARKTLKNDFQIWFPTLESELIKTLEIMFDDTLSVLGSNISWFCYDCDFGRCDPDSCTLIFENGHQTTISTAAALYDHLVKSIKK